MLACTCIAEAQTTNGGGLRMQLRDFASPVGSEQTASAVSTLVALEVSTAPLGTSTGGFTFTYDPLLRIWSRSAQSFGPSFAERSLTTGRAKISTGFNFLHANYNSFAGQDLTNGDFIFVKNIQDVAFPADDHTRVRLDVVSDTSVFFSHAGLTDRLDIGVAVPWVRVQLEAHAGLFDRSNAMIFKFDSIAQTADAGIGDIAVFGKYQLWRSEESGVALAVETRLPTGDEEELRGLGVTRTLTSVIWSHGGVISPHANVGYEFWSDEVPISESGDVFAKDQIKYAAGIEFEAHPRMTIIVDLVGRQLRHGGKVDYESFDRPAGSIDALVGVSGGIQQVSLVPGLKWNAWRSVLLTGNVLVALSDEGLKASVIPVVGLDWAF
jgi:hypothetical protein